MGKDGMSEGLKVVQASLENVTDVLEKINKKQDEHGAILADVRIEQARSFEQRSALLKSFDQHVDDDRTMFHEIKNRVIPLESERWKNRGIAASIAAMLVFAKDYFFRGS